MEYELKKNDWHLLSSPLQGMISGEWYAPKGTARQATTYFEPVTFNTTDYDRYSPAVYQRGWDKAKAVLYEPGAVWNANDESQTDSLGTGDQGEWVVVDQSASTYRFDTTGADEYLQRITYKPFDLNKANVAIKGTWSNVFNDHTVKYDEGGFSVMVINDLKGEMEENAAKTAVFRLPKEDTFYDIWNWDQNSVEGQRTTVDLVDNNLVPKRGRLRSDALKTDATMTMALANEGNGSLGRFLASNPFICGLDVAKLMNHEDNTANLVKTVTIMTENGQKVYSFDTDENRWELDNVPATPIVPPGQAFFVTVPSDKDQNTLENLTFTTDMMTTAYPEQTDASDGNTTDGNTTGGNGSRLLTRGAAATPTSLVITAERGRWRSSAVVKQSTGASDKFIENEDVATFIDENILACPTVYTLVGRLATTVNRLHDFSVLPLGIESNSDADCMVTFRGVETISADGLQLYDAVEQTQTPITSGTTVTLPGLTQNRYFLLGGTRTAIEAAQETHLQIFAEGRSAHVISSTSKPIRSVHCYDTAGRLVHSATPQTTDYSFDLHTAGIYIIDAQTDTDRKTRKIMTR